MEAMEVSVGEKERNISGSDLSEDGEEQILNCYGSPVRVRRREQQVAGPGTSGNIDRVVCSYKNTCSRKKTTRYEGCPCQNANQKCSTNCSCGTKSTACKNKAEEGQHKIRNSSAFTRHRRAVEESELEIKGFVEKLSADNKDKLFIRLLSQGRSSLEYAKNMLGEDPDPPNAPEPEENAAEPLCICGVFRRMADEQENVCCMKRTSVTSHVMFNTVCLDQEVLQLAIRARCDIRADEPDYSTQSCRKATYRQYTLWKYGKLGRGNRKILPYCVVSVVRQAYLAPDGSNMGFRRS